MDKLSKFLSVTTFIFAVMSTILILLVLKYYIPLPTSISPDWALAVVNGIATRS